MTETLSAALVLFATGALLLVSALVSRITHRAGLPVALVFLALGMLAGEEGLGGIRFDDHALALRLGLAALALILFDGGLNTSVEQVRRWMAPSVVLATAGVVITAALVTGAARLLGLGWDEAALLGAVVSSTDAAAVFAALRASGIQLKQRVGATLELESGLNDPMAFILTLAAIEAIAPGRGPGAWALLAVPAQLAVGAVLGIGLGRFGRFVLRQARLSVAGLYPVMTIALALLAFAIPSLVQGSGLLAVYVAAMVMGRGPLPYNAGIRRVHDAIAWFAQVGMFLLLGMLVTPSALAPVALPAVAIGLVLALVARPVAVALCLLPFRYPAREILYVGCVGLRGAVPIILATFPVLAGASGAARVFDLVFFVVVVNALVPGALVRRLTRALGLESAAPAPPPASLEITSTMPLAEEILSFHVDRASAVSGSTIAELPFPPASAVVLVVRGAELLAPRGGTRLEVGDHVHVFCRPEDKPLIQLLFGRLEGE